MLLQICIYVIQVRMASEKTEGSRTYLRNDLHRTNTQININTKQKKERKGVATITTEKGDGNNNSLDVNMAEPAVA